MNKKFDKQQELEDDLIRIIPLKVEHYEPLYQVASDHMIWAQHPNNDRGEREVFRTFFILGLVSKGAYLILDKKTDEIMGTSRYYDLEEDQVAIGFTFLARKFWGGVYNSALKKLMINHAFESFDAVVFHVGNQNLRSQKAVEKLGAKKIAEQEVYPAKLNYIYRLTKSEWNSR